ncbi:XRE family transcriptional regulator [Sulfurimonas sp. SAG-AH-194-I05]|nr:DUF6166 domain-containing protein [Sulfurimonas sp. SAG-AH-194-I05]MDF1874919.1 XRE family transcriptional regulator [Sulfurimonas sp. SAG-AH-194-I05]
MALNMNNHAFKGHKTLLGSKYVTYGEVELPLRYDLYEKSSKGFDWGHNGPASMQLAFSVLYQIKGRDTANKHVLKFTQEVIKRLNTRDWILDAVDVLRWLQENEEDSLENDSIKEEIKISQEEEVERKEALIKPKMEKLHVVKPAKKLKSRKDNVVKLVCKELGITQKQLAEILEVPEGTVSSWAVKNEIPRLGKKAIEFYTQSTRNQRIVDSYKDFMCLLQAS